MTYPVPSHPTHAQLSWFGSSATAEWFTPKPILDRVVRMLGAIDLDPCSDEARTVPARIHYRKRDDGLSQSWFGAVYMNPPYGRGSVMPQWIGKLMRETGSGRAREVIALLPARTETRWFKSVWTADALCFWYGRIQFGTSAVNAPFPSVAAYFGGRRDRFAEEFGEVGKVVYP